MPLMKKSSAAVAEPPTHASSDCQPTQPAASIPTPEQLAQVATVKEKVGKSASMSRDDYWRRREERDVQRDKDMAWSGLAQAAMQSVGLVQLNTNNTLEGLVELVVKTTNLLLKARDDK